MNSTNASTEISQLRVFHDDSLEKFDNHSLANQLPFIETLVEQFELVTGWKLSFAESRDSYQRRSICNDESTVFGGLQITDLFEDIDAGTSARHRGHCNQLTETLDGMIHLIQSDRQRFLGIGRSLNEVVDVPFDWWGTQGNCGFDCGAFSSWSITNDEKIRLFAGHLNSEDSIDSALSASVVLSAFETACLSSLPLHEIAPILPAVVQKSAQTKSRLDWFTTIELDPVMGEYELDGFNSMAGVTIIDVHTSTALELAEDENSGILYAGQILGVGVSRRDIDRINDLIAGQELTVDHCLQIIGREFSQSPSIFLYRK